MRKDNPFDRLFRLGAETWTEDRIQQFKEDVESGFFDTDPVEKYNGYRRSEVNGDVTEEVLVDGEWITLSEAEPDTGGSGVDFVETEDGYEFTLDVSGYIPLGSFDASASINNGVIRVEVTSVE